MADGEFDELHALPSKKKEKKYKRQKHGSEVKGTLPLELKGGTMWVKTWHGR
jgi:hypothetical protein